MENVSILLAPHVVGEGGRKTYLHNCEDLWMHFRGGEKSLNI